MGTRLHIVVSEELVERIDALRGDLVPRSAWIRNALDYAVGKGERYEAEWMALPPERRAAVEQALGGRPGASVSPGVQLPAPAPAEQLRGGNYGRRAAAPEPHPEDAEQPSRPLPHYNEGDALPPAKSQTFPKDVYRGPEVEAEWRARSSVQAKRDVRPVPKAKP